MLGALDPVLVALPPLSPFGLAFPHGVELQFLDTGHVILRGGLGAFQNGLQSADSA